MLLRRRKAIVCQEAVELATDYLEGALSNRDRARLEAHLDACPHCHEYFDQIRTMIRVLGRVEPEALPAEALEDLVGLYRRYQAG